MAKVRKGSILSGMSGSLGKDLMLRHLRDGQTVAQTKPDFSDRKLSREQKEHHSRFKEAAAYAKVAAQREPLYAELAAGTIKNAYNIALGDWFHAPLIQRIERKNGRIRVSARDNVRVARVQVTILDQEGKVVEKGEGIRGKGDWWEYRFNAQGKILAEAWDLAGNKASLVVE